MNYYKVLGLTETATLSEIKSAYRLLVKRYHPDVRKYGYTEYDKNKLAQIQEAYKKLMETRTQDEFVSPRKNMPEYNKNKTTVHVHIKPNGVRTGTYVNGKLVR